MSRIKLALEVVGDLRSLAESIETLVNAVEEPEEAKVIEETKVVEEAKVIEETKETKKKPKKSEEVKKDVAKVEVVTEIKDSPLPEGTAKEKQPTLEEVRALMADKNRDGHREAVKAILNKYGAQKLTSLDPSHYKEVIKEVGEIK